MLCRLRFPTATSPATALLTIKRHGESAAYFAASRADQLEEQGAQTGALTWRRILKEIERLQAMEPESAHETLSTSRSTPRVHWVSLDNFISARE